jgi:hypothetical protein
MGRTRLDEATIGSAAVDNAVHPSDGFAQRDDVT